MTPAPGTLVTIRDEAVARVVALDSATWFVTGFTETGPTTPQPIRSLAAFADTFGGRLAHSVLYDALDVFFREGGSVAYVQRVVGPDPVYATLSLEGATAGTAASLIVSATEYGSKRNELQIEVEVSGADFEIIVTDADDVVVERSGLLADRAAAVAWGAVPGRFVSVALGVDSADPSVQAATPLAGGRDDYANATETQWTAALATFDRELGPGQVSAPGRTTEDAHLALAQHASENYRVALLDLADTATAADLAAAAEAVRDGGYGRAAAAFAPWAYVAGTAAGSTRTVPYSAVQAGLIARSEALGNSPNVPAAGVNGEASFVNGLTQEPFSESDRETLNDAGVNVIREIRGAFRTYGYRTLVDAEASPNWRELGGARVVAAIAHAAYAIAEDHAFVEIDGRGIKVGEFRSRLEAMCLGYYNANALYGATPEAAFVVDTTVNTAETIDAGQLLARIELATSPFAERVEITITKTS